MAWITSTYKHSACGSFRSAAEPIVLFLETSRPRYLVLKLRADDLNAVRSAVEHRWREVVGDFPIDPFFLEDQYATLYQSDEIGAMVGFFALLAIGVACMGLYGLASFITVQRTREIAIRKVFGMTVQKACPPETPTQPLRPW